MPVGVNGVCVRARARVKGLSLYKTQITQSVVF